MDIKLLVVAIVAAAAGYLVTIAAQKIGGLGYRRMGTLGIGGALKARFDAKRDGAQRIADFGESTMGQAIEDMIPATERQKAEQREALMRSGLKIPVATFQAVRMLCIAVFLILGAALGSQMLDGGLRILSAIALGAVVGAVLPQLYLIEVRAKWRDEIERQLPSAIDLMCVSVSAGSTFEAAVRSVADNLDGELGEAFRDVMAQSRYMDVTDALKAFADNAGVKPLSIFAASLLSSRSSGSELVDVLKNQARCVRQYRRMKLEEEINKLPVKMIIPIIFFIFPALFGVILVPAALNLIQQMAGV